MCALCLAWTPAIHAACLPCLTISEWCIKWLESAEVLPADLPESPQLLPHCCAQRIMHSQALVLQLPKSSWTACLAGTAIVMATTATMAARLRARARALHMGPTFTTGAVLLCRACTQCSAKDGPINLPACQVTDAVLYSKASPAFLACCLTLASPARAVGRGGMLAGAC